MTKKPLDRHLNAAVLAMAARLFPTGFDVSPDAPSSLRALNTLLGKPEAPKPGARMVVFDGGSAHTIYADDEVNYAFRAWHDWTHWRYQFDFSLAGERATYMAQVFHLVKAYGDCDTVTRWSNILHAEIVGQAEYYARHKRYVGRQLDFVRACLSVGIEDALDHDWSV